MLQILVLYRTVTVALGALYAELCFDVLLTVHLSIILVINQHNTQIHIL